MKHENLLDKYYKGETSIEEEQELKSLILQENEFSAEQDIFKYFEKEAAIPEGLEDNLFIAVQEKASEKRRITRRIYSVVSAAAVVLIVFSVYLNARSNRKMQMEDNFFVMEQALFQISESIQPPQEQKEMLVLWVDNDVEIIIN
jgi:hypothetical protein